LKLGAAVTANNVESMQALIAEATRFGLENELEVSLAQNRLDALRL